MTGQTPQKVFQCEVYKIAGRCPEQCVRPVAWQVDCYDCYGDDPNCETCSGSGIVRHGDCPRSSASKVHLLPYFLHWRQTNFMAWPDGGSILEQPQKLRKAFDLLLMYFLNREKKENEKNASSPGVRNKGQRPGHPPAK